MQIDVPLQHRVDVLVLGGSTGAVEAAISAAEAGCRVLCASSYTYPGEDVCAPAAYWPEHRYPSTTDLGRRVLPELPPGALPRPMHLKYVLEQALIAAGVEILYMTHAVRPLHGADGRIAGAVLANRSGFQAVAAAVVIDATQRAEFARLLPDVSFRPFVPDTYTVTHVVAGAAASGAAAQRLEPLPGRFQAADRRLIPYRSVTEHRLEAPTVDALAEVDALARMTAWYPGQLMSADRPAVRLGRPLHLPGGGVDRWSDA